MWSKNSLYFVCAAQILLCQSFICITSVIFEPYHECCCHFQFFGFVQKCTDKKKLPMFFEGAAYCPFFKPVARTPPAAYLLSRPARPPCKSACCWMPIRCPKKCLKPQIFSALSKSAVFGHVSWKLTKSGRSWCWENMFVIFQFLVQWSNDNKFAPPQKQITYQLVAKSHSY